MEIGIVRQINIDAEMQASYLDYAMSVIVARALPDVRDGLKPVHRRILYAMHDLGLQHDKPYKKSARIVGEVLGKYHPHGDAAVYEAMVRMAQDFSLRYPLVDGQGNFGSIDGDNAAAMRYTEARLAAIAAEMLTDIEKDTVDWVPNFDGTLKEPSVLPAALPNLIVNGSSGIAVGMSTSIPPHNLSEVCDALCHLIDNHRHIEDVTIEDLMRFIPGPDFPTGGVVYRYAEETNGGQTEQVDMIAHAYASGKGRIVVQAKAHIEEMTRNRSRIVVTELPYQTDKSNLLERIAELVRDGRLEGITDLRDESDRTGMRVCIEMTRTVEPREVLAELFRLTPLQSTFSVSLLALVDGEPRHLSLKRMLQYFIEHRQEVILRRSRHDLEKARLRAHILEGLLRALDILDEVIALIRRSRTADTARQNLIEQLKFTEIQAQAILDMQLRRLAALERRKLDEEYKETLALIKELEELLASPAKVLALIRRNLTDLKARYGDARRTQIADRTKGALTAKDVLPDQEVWVTLSNDGLLSRVARAGSRHPLLGAKGLAPWCLPVHTRQDLYLLSAKGQATRVPVYQVPDGVGAHYADISGLTRRDRVAAVCAFPEAHGDQPSPGYLLLGTSQGKVKRVALADLAAQAHANPQVIGLDAGDELAWAGVSAGGGEILLVTAAGQAIRFTEEDVRAMGLPAGGIGGIKLQGKDRVVAGCGIPAGADGQITVAFIMAGGFGKRVPLAEFPVQGRNGQGVIASKPTPRTGNVVGAVLVAPGDLLACLTGSGAVKVLRAAVLPETARANLGKAVLALGSGELVQTVYGTTGGGAEEPAPPEPKARKPKAAPEAKPAAAAEAKTARPPARAAGPKAEGVPKRKPDAEAPAKPPKPGREAPTAVIVSAPSGKPPAQPAKAGAPTAKPKSEGGEPGGRPGKVEAAAPALPSEAVPAKSKPPMKPAAAPPAGKAPAKTPPKGAAGQLPLMPPSEEKKGRAAAAKQEPAIPDDLSVKEMQGRTISRADLEKLIRGEISQLPSPAQTAAKPKPAGGGAQPPARPSASAKAAPAGKAPGKPPAKGSAAAAKTSSSAAPSKPPAGKPASGAASSEPTSRPSAPAKPKAAPAAKSKPGDAASKPPGKPAGSAAGPGSTRPATGAAKPPPPKPKSGSTAAKPPTVKTKP